MSIQRLGPYKVEKVVGRGGMGTVFAATHIRTGERAAVKVLAAVYAQDPQFQSRFEGEIETLRKLDHPNIVRLFAHGQQDGNLFFAMELVEGRTLFDDLRKKRRFAIPDALKIGIQICDALRHAHDRGVVHRDLKPANLLLDVADHVKLTDFGIARLFDRTGVTSPGGVLGTADYMAPEQARGAEIGAHSDLYSLGCVLFAMLTGEAPFASKSVAETLARLQSEVPPPLRTKNQATPVRLEKLVQRLLEKEPAKRISTAQAVGNRLREILDELPPPANETRVDSPSEYEFEFDERVGDGLTQPGNSSHAKTTSPVPPDPIAPGEKSPSTDPGTNIRDTHVAREPKKTPDTHEAPTVVAGEGGHDSEEFEVYEKPTISKPATSVDPASRQRMRTPAPSPNPASTSPASKGPTDFTTVESELHTGPAPPSPLPTIAKWGALMGTLLFIVAMIAYALTPMSADSLYAAIARQAETGETKDLLSVRNEIAQFLRRFSDDPRAPEVQSYASELELFIASKRAKLHGDTAPEAANTLAEREYARAMRLVDSDPAAAIAILHAVADVFGDDPHAPERVSLTAKLSRRQAETLEKQFSQSGDIQQNELTKQLDRADAMRDSQPLQARKIYQGVIVLYQHKPWASPLVQRAQRALGE